MFQINLAHKIAWVTGASRGIGRSIAITLAELGCDVAVGFNTRKDGAVAVAEEIKKLGRRAVIVGGDMGIEGDVVKMHEAIEAELGTVDILINNAGTIADNLFLSLEDGDWKKVIDANIMGVVYATKVVMRGMMMKRSGRVVNMSSVAATKGGRGQANYAATKGAVESMTRSLATEFASRGITVNCIAPGVIETDMSKEIISLGKDEILLRQLIKRFGRADEIAGWVAMLVSQEFGGFMTGQVIHVDGGVKMA